MGSEKKIPERYNYVLLDRMVEAKYGQYVQYIDYAILQAELATQRKKLGAGNKRLRKALKRLKSGEAMYVGGMIPKGRLRQEFLARYRFITLVLEGVDVKNAAEQAGDEQHQKTLQALKDNK